MSAPVDVVTASATMAAHRESRTAVAALILTVLRNNLLPKSVRTFEDQTRHEEGEAVIVAVS